MVRFRFGEPLCNETLSLRVLAARFAKALLWMKDSGLILQVWDVWGCLHNSKSLFEEASSDHDKLYESSRRKPGWRFTAGYKFRNEEQEASTVAGAFVWKRGENLH